MGASGAGGRGFCVNGTVGDGTVARPTGTGDGVGFTVTVNAAVGVWAPGVVVLVVGAGRCLGARIVLGF